MEQAISNLLAFITTCVLILVLTPVAKRIDLVDRPGGRKTHDGDIPLTGGIAMCIGLLVGLLTLPIELSASLLSIATASTVLLAVGLADDIHGLSPRIRIVAAILACLLLIKYDRLQLNNLGNLLGTGDILLGMWEIPFTIFAIIGVINALNMSDGMDGLAGGLTMIALLGMALLAWDADAHRAFSLVCTYIAIVSAFLCFNARTPWRHHARIFMGDGGSMFLGIALAGLLIALSQTTSEHARAMTPVTALWLFALPLLDTVSVMLRRIMKGRSPFGADREHFHHVLLAAGYSPGIAVAFMLALATMLASIGIAGYYSGIAEAMMFYGFVGIFIIYFFGMQHAWKVMKTIKAPARRILHKNS